MPSDSTIIYNAQLDAFDLYHIHRNTSPDAYPDHSFGRDGSIGPALPALGHAMAGSVATALTKGLVYPLDLIIARLQVQRSLRGSGETDSAGKDAGAEYTDVVDAARKIYANEGGIKAFYTGCAPDVAKGLVDSFLFFLAYSFVRQYELKKANAKSLSVAKELGVGIAAGAFSKLVTTPIQNVVTRLQTAALVAARHPSESQGQPKPTVSSVAKKIYAERGLPGFWAGYSMAAVLTLNPAITFAVDNLFKKLLPKSKRENPGAWLTFLMAALSKVIATSVTYPVTLAKSRAQAASSPKEKQPSEKAQQQPQSKLHKVGNTALSLLWANYSLYQALRTIYETEGVSGLYSGLEGEWVKGFISHGMTMMIKDRVHIGVVEGYYVLLKLTKRWEEELRRAQESASGAARQAKEGLEDLGESLVEGAKEMVQGEE